MFSSELQKFLSLNKSKKIVFTNGCFDILHFGHVYYLNEAKKLGDLLIVGLNSDSSVRTLKGANRPINIESHRKYILENLKCVDFVEIFSEETPLKLIEFIKPSVLVKGGDYKPDTTVGYDFVTKNDGRVEILSFIDGLSTTNLIKKISDN